MDRMAFYATRKSLFGGILITINLSWVGTCTIVSSRYKQNKSTPKLLYQIARAMICFFKNKKILYCYINKRMVCHWIYHILLAKHFFKSMVNEKSFNAKAASIMVNTGSLQVFFGKQVFNLTYISVRLFHSESKGILRNTLLDFFLMWKNWFILKVAYLLKCVSSQFLKLYYYISWHA